MKVDETQAPAPDAAEATDANALPALADPPTPGGSSGRSWRWLKTLALIALGLTVGWIAFVGIQRFLHRPVPIPDAVAGVKRIHGSLSENFQDQMEGEAKRFGLQARSAVFGSRGEAEFLVVVVDEPASEAADGFFTSFSRGMAQGGATVGARATKGQLKGARFRCVEASGPGVHAGTCMWRSDDHVGFVLDLDGDLKTAQQLTSKVYRALR